MKKKRAKSDSKLCKGNLSMSVSCVWIIHFVSKTQLNFFKLIPKTTHTNIIRYYIKTFTILYFSKIYKKGFIFQELIFFNIYFVPIVYTMCFML